METLSKLLMELTPYFIPNFIRLNISVMSIPAGLSDVKLSGKLRCILHLIDDYPYVQEVEIMFVNPPIIDFQLDGAANFLNLPG